MENGECRLRIKKNNRKKIPLLRGGRRKPDGVERTPIPPIRRGGAKG